jgi:hypothetical protein
MLVFINRCQRDGVKNRGDDNGDSAISIDVRLIAIKIPKVNYNIGINYVRYCLKVTVIEPISRI